MNSSAKGVYYGELYCEYRIQKAAFKKATSIFRAYMLGLPADGDEAYRIIALFQSGSLTTSEALRFMELY